MCRLKWILSLPLLLSALSANEVLVHTKGGSTYYLHVDSDETLQEVQEHVLALTEEEPFVIALLPDDHGWEYQVGRQGGYLGHPRNYDAPVTRQEAEDIRFIITSLADASAFSLLILQGDLEKAGDRIDHIHPLRFLMTVFLDEELKVGIRNMRGRGWIWNQFVGGIKESLDTESKIGNMKNEDVINFAKIVEISESKIFPYICVRNWDGLIDTLITAIPRKGDHDRYDN